MTGAPTAADEPAAPMPNAADKPPAVPPAAMPQALQNTAPGVGFALRVVPKATAAERLAREEGMARALALGARPYRDGAGKGRHIPFKEANLAAVEPWVRDPRAKRGYRRTQELRKAAGQLVGQPGDKIEIAKRLGQLHWEQGSDVEGAARRGLYDAIWSREHVYDTFTVPRRYGRSTLIDTGRIAAVAEEEARKIQAEDPKARGGFWVRDRNDFGLLYVVANSDPEENAAEKDIVGGEGELVLLGQVSTPPAPPPQKLAAPPQPSQTPTSPTQSGQTQTKAPRVTNLPASADDLFMLYRQRLAPIEGGLANRPAHADPGGETNKGVSQILLDDLHKYKSKEYGHYPMSSGALTDDQIEAILRKEIFDPLHIWKVAQIPNLLTLAPELVEQIFDIGVLHGVGF
ncbi:MAG TPA: glycosyl hydrolase 108 family protein, partial [Kiloniellaceae bacterium]|nr:glycosyl hydrolase 108 family protein [Kiloniellaceae bacterium]